ncbi:MAG: glycoside hydrolase family 2, partial [Clostridia bacterium]|nr:glycoside hydrolase family 2 [Clostridia bacterium]
NGENVIKRLTLESNETASIEITDPRIWSPEDPFLYDIEITTEADSVKSYFGMRSVSLAMGPAGRDMLLLNGKPVFLNGPLDQGYWPESGMTQPCEEAIVFDLQSMKDLGFNTIRKHIKIESRRWYYHADRLGLAVIQDMPSGGREMTGYLRDVLGIVFHNMQPDNDSAAYEAALRESTDSRKSYEDELEEMIVHLHNHPSVIIWCPFNEAWGQFDSVRIYEFIKQLDPSRLVDHASGWFDQGCGDFRSVHTYKKSLKAPPMEDCRAYLVSEYGGYNYIDSEHLWRNDDTFGYKYYKTPEELNKAYTDLIETQVIPLIEKGLCGVIYTQLSDVEIETNGFFTYDRKLMKFNEVEIKRVHDSVQKAFTDFNLKK